MDIDLFSEMVRNLILDNDEVALPGLGTFVSEVMPSTFSDKGYTINPPYRKLSFRQRGSEDGSLLTAFYSKANGTDPETSRRILSDFISGLRNTLLARKMVVFPGLGRLRATKENTFFFIADEDLDIYPYGVGLEPVSLKAHQETSDDVARSVAELRELVADAVPVTEPESPVAEPVAAADGDGAESAAPVTEPVAAADGDGAESAALVTEPVEVIDDDADKESLRQARRPDEKIRLPEEEVQRPGNEETVTEETKEPHTGKKQGWKVTAMVAASVVGVALLALGIFLLLARIAPGFIDSILYTPEELRIINH